MENIENQMQAFEESVGLNKAEVEENEKKLADFEGQMEEERNEGLFFKNLRQRRSVDKAKAKEEMEKIKQLSRESAGSNTRRTIYLALIGLVVVGIADVFISSLRKGAVLGIILVCLLSQVIYEQSFYQKPNWRENRHRKNEKSEILSVLLPTYFPKKNTIREYCSMSYNPEIKSYYSRLIYHAKFYLASCMFRDNTAATKNWMRI